MTSQIAQAVAFGLFIFATGLFIGARIADRSTELRMRVNQQFKCAEKILVSR